MDSNIRICYVVTSISIERNPEIEILQFHITVAVSHSVIFLMFFLLTNIFCISRLHRYFDVTFVFLRSGWPMPSCPGGLVSQYGLLVVRTFNGKESVYYQRLYYQMRVDSGQSFDHICQACSINRVVIVGCTKDIGKPTISKTRKHNKTQTVYILSEYLIID